MTNIIDDLNNSKNSVALIFGGQGSPWRSVVQQLAIGSLELEFKELQKQVDLKLQPIKDQFIVIRPEAKNLLNSDRLDDAGIHDSDAALSIPGILYAQYLTLRSLINQGFDIATVRPELVDGHSQGILAKELVEAVRNNDQERLVQIFVIANILGYSASKVSANQNIFKGSEATPMLSVNGADASVIESVIKRFKKNNSFKGEVSIAVQNDDNRYIVSGYPNDLLSLISGLEIASAKSKALLEQKEIGGVPLEVTCEFLDVTVPFHSVLLSPAIEHVFTWANTCQIDVSLAAQMAMDVLVNPVNWQDSVQKILKNGGKYLVDLGPSDVVGKMTKRLLTGTGAGVVDAGDAKGLQSIARADYEWNPSPSWERFSPTLIKLPNGKEVVDTAFTRLTGKSPILLAGMTPTTVEPEIVAAAANAGYWAEMAGGGQVTADVFEENLAGLQSLLKPGQTAQFNSMFLDRYLWNLQFGGTKIVSRARAAGAPLDGVIITAGIPEYDEAVELVQTLNKEGFPFVTFKPGTVAQINQVLNIAKAVPDYKVIMEVEDGHAGGHHSWENLDDLLITTYPSIREVENVILCVGGGIGKPEHGAKYISGDWSLKYNKPKMPVDGVLVGTVAMTTKEAHTTPDVKQLLLETPGIDVDKFEEELKNRKDELVATDTPLGHAHTWVGSGKSKGGMTSGLSHLRADIYEIDNDSAKCARLISEVGSDDAEIQKNRDAIITALNKTAKPYFGDLESMSYYEMAARFATLCFLPGQKLGDKVEESWIDRFYDILQRVEARISPVQAGEITSLFESQDAVVDYQKALDKLETNYPETKNIKVNGSDAAWFIEVCRKHPKPVPFVPRLDNELFKWWGSDSLWQSEDGRYKASQCRIIPGPVSVAGIDRIDEPIADLLGRFENEVVNKLSTDGVQAKPAFSRLGKVTDAISYIKESKHISWTGHLINNPANFLDASQFELKETSTGFDLIIKLDTYWDEDEDSTRFHAARKHVIPLIVNDDATVGVCPIVDENKLPETMFSLLSSTAGVGSSSTVGEFIENLPQMQKVSGNNIGGVEFSQPNFGRAKFSFTITDNLGLDHGSVTGSAINVTKHDAFERINCVPDAILGMCWPPIYAALGSASITLGNKENYPVIEGLFNAVHLDHTVDMVESLCELRGKKLNVYTWAEDLRESVSGRIVDVRVVLTIDGTGETPEQEKLAIRFRERFAIQGRASGHDIPPAPDEAGGKLSLVGRKDAIIPTKRRLLRAVRVQAPSDMTPFARVSGDFNPIHTSTNAARIAGLDGPIVHGMWLSAVAQHLISAKFGKENGFRISGWTAQWYAPTNLGDILELTLERTGKVRGGGLVLEVIAKIDGNLTAKFTATTVAPKTAYCYPGQGIQHQGMGLDERQLSKAADQVWKEADAHTRKTLGFSIINIVKDNPTDIYANGVHYHHPDGILNLTQFTQVALTTVGFAQTARLREDGAAVDGSFFAGHSLGEYVGLSAYAHVIPLGSVLELVFARGSAMHSLVPRDENGRSNYLMGALRPNQFGVSDKDVKSYVASVSEACGEFLEIVNYNLAGQQYAVAGTIAGLKALKEDSAKRVEEFGGKGAFMYVPGIDVPFHSSKLRDGVPEFRDKLMKLLPEVIDYEALVGRYVPNLVAIPFSWDISFAKAILDVVPSEIIQRITESEAAWNEALKDKDRLGRILVVELLCWQFASPVRWIETQALLFTSTENGGLGIENFVEIGLKNSPTLANLASKTLSLPDFGDSDVQVYNVQRDEMRVYFTDDDSAVDMEAFAEDAQNYLPKEEAETKSVVASSAPVAIEQVSTVQAEKVEASTPVAQPSQGGNAPAASDITFKASDAISALFAYANKLLPEQIGPNDNAETLTNGVSSRRNQLLMDMSAELGLASIDSAAEAPVSSLLQTVDKMAHNYKAFGPVLSEVIRSHIRKLFGAANAKQTRIAERVSSTWGLGEGWVSAVTIELLLGTREGQSMRGGDLANLGSEAPANAAGVDALIDSAVQSVASRLGVSVSQQGAGGSGAGGGVVDSAALDEFANKVVGDNGVLAKTARGVLKQLGLENVPDLVDTTEAEENAAVIEAVNAELGQDWPEKVAPKFDANKVVFFDDRWALAKEDLAVLWAQGLASGVQNHHFVGTGKAVADMASFYASELRKLPSETNEELARVFDEKAAKAVDMEAYKNAPYRNDIAVITGATPSSIAGAIAAKLLNGGAKVIITASNINSKRLDYAKKLYRENATGGAELYLVPANLSSFRDVDALVEWVGSELKETVGGKTKIIKPALKPTLLFPFAAPAVKGTLADAGSEAEMETRLLLWSVERMIAGLSKVGTDTDVAHKLHVILPGSPNRGIFGGDGAYGEVKSAFDAIEKRWKVERRWANSVTIAHPKIGWVRGTSLMGGNDPLVEAVEKVGVHTYSTPEIADELLALCTNEARKEAAINPLDADLTGGLGGSSIDLAALKRDAIAKMKADMAAAQASEVAQSSQAVKEVKIKALPNPIIVKQPEFRIDEWSGVTAKLEDLRVIVGIGEVGPWGSGRTRFEAEHGIQSDGSVDLTPAGVLELAWMMNLVHWSDTPKAGWYDSDDNFIPEEELFEKFRDEVAARSGVRAYIDDDPAWIKDLATEQNVAVYLDKDITFSVESKELAMSYYDIDPERTIISENTETGEWDVTKLTGAKTRVPRKAAMTRKVGGQLPTNFDPARWGIPASMLESVDRLAIWNLVATVDAFLSSGFTPAELLQSIHPSDIGSTQGTGIGGTDSMRKLFVDGFLGEDRPSDILQEALPNVIAAHVMQSFVGGYGVMVHPVGACATAAVSIEDAVDKIDCGKADFVVAGAIDDISIESITGFGDMNATAKTDDLRDKGIQDRFVSRANDRRRGGFVESEGGGTVLVTRGDIAAKLGLPVFGVLGYARSFADGAHTSIPAPGLGALGSVRGGKDSKFVKQLASLGVTPDEIKVISKHDTSTNANDPNESELYTRISEAIGRTKGNPFYVISQKTVTGHAKGGAAVFQVHGLCQLFRSSVIPGNKALDCVGPEFITHGPITWLRAPLDLRGQSSIKAGLVTSLGFGHVSALIAVINPGSFAASLINEKGESEYQKWLTKANSRLKNGVNHLEDAMLQKRALFEPIDHRRFKDGVRGYDSHEVEATLLTDPNYRLDENGTY